MTLISDDHNLYFRDLDESGELLHLPKKENVLCIETESCFLLKLYFVSATTPIAMENAGNDKVRVQKRNDQ